MIVEVSPLQIGESAAALTVGFTVTVTTTCAELVQVPVAPITVYVSLVEGVAVTVPPLLVFSVIAGVQV